MWYLAGETSVKAPASKIVGSRAQKAVNQNKKQREKINEKKISNSN
ncbi:hypothetical protein LXM63_08265 [Chryseobacterium gleum]|nr:hypothetical protein [Chryseobacterium gleum]MCE4065087.1 hypothetical protein [Chryseobacterium gleum]